METEETVEQEGAGRECVVALKPGQLGFVAVITIGVVLWLLMRRRRKA